MKRNYTSEAIDSQERRYAYDFDTILRRYMMKSFQPFLPKGKALELGCYQGAFTSLITAAYDDVTVVEAAENLIADAKARVGAKVTFIHSVFEEVELAAEYDAIFFIHTLEHLDDAVGVLKRVKKWLSPTGKLFLAVPNAHAPSRQIAVKMGLISHNDAVTPAEFEHGHRITYSFDTLERDVTNAGLSIEHRGGVFFKPLANFQFDTLIAAGTIDSAYLDGCYALGMQYPDLCASIYMICSRGE